MTVSERLENYIWREIDAPTKEEKAFSAFKKEIHQEIIEIENELDKMLNELREKGLVIYLYVADNVSAAYFILSILYKINDRQASGRADFCYIRTSRAPK